MPSPGASSAPRLPMDHAYLELLADTLESMDIPARSQFLQRYFRTTTQLDLRESQCLQLWEEMLTRRRELSTQLRRPISLATVLMDVLSTAGLIRVPVMLEYGEFRKLQVNAVTDPLTGLYNRRLFAESFEKELNRARRYGLPLSILILDLRRFKDVNDKYGHPRGDDVLRAVAGTLQKTMRTSDSAFRIGGDEFALLLPQTDAPQALALSRRIGSVFAESLDPLHPGDQCHHRSWARHVPPRRRSVRPIDPSGGRTPVPLKACRSCAHRPRSRGSGGHQSPCYFYYCSYSYSYSPFRSYRTDFHCVRSNS